MSNRKSHKVIPKHHRIRERLRQRILAGALPAGSRLPPDTELFKRYRVNRLTVIQALNDLVREGLIVRRRGDGTYVANRRNPPLFPGRHLRLGLLWRQSVMPERLLTTFQGGITRGCFSAWGLSEVEPEWSRIERNETTRGTWTCVERGLTVECVGEALESRDHHPTLEAVRDGRFDGLMCLSILDEAWLKQVQNLGLPTVLVDIPHSRLNAPDTVYVDPLSAYRGAVEHFAARGLKRIFFVGSFVTDSLTDIPPRVDPDSFLRLNAYRQAMNEQGLPVKEEWVHCAWHDSRSVDPLAQKLIHLPEHERPEAVVCHSIAQAELLIEAFACHNLKLEGAGCSGKVSSTGARAILIEPKWLGEAAAALLVSRLQQPNRPSFRVGVPMQFDLQPVEQPLNAAVAK